MNNEKGLRCGCKRQSIYENDEWPSRAIPPDQARAENGTGPMTIRAHGTRMEPDESQCEATQGKGLTHFLSGRPGRSLHVHSLRSLQISCSDSAIFMNPQGRYTSITILRLLLPLFFALCWFCFLVAMYLSIDHLFPPPTPFQGGLDRPLAS